MDSMNMNNSQDSVSPESPAKKSPSSHYPGTKDGYTLLSKSYMASLISCAVSAVCTILYLCYFFINPEAGELSDDVSNVVGFILFSLICKHQNTYHTLHNFFQVLAKKK